MDPKDIPLSGFDKAMNARWALVFLSSLAFIDCYLIIRYGINIANINTTWIKAHIDFSDALNFVGFFTVTFGLLIPGLATIGKIILGSLIDRLIYKYRNRTWSSSDWKESIDKIDHINYIEKNELREWAIKTANLAAYKDYERFEKNAKEIAFISFMCQSFIFISIVGWLMSNDSNPVLIEVITAKIESLKWYLSWPLKLIWVGLCIFYVGMAFRNDHIYDNYIYLKNHNIAKH
ncbi:hypothetical protein ACS016_09885 [Aeromonas veronii]|uniref:hypothetical protein n=1 Tax=Aeromonas veronii TaxID=654 RepID=UPI0038EE26CE